MNKIIGRKEAVTILFFVAMPQLLIDYINYGISRHNSGYWINFIICSILAFMLFLPLKRSFNKKINSYIDNSLIEKIIGFIFIVYIISLLFYNFSICTNAIMSVTSGVFTRDIVSFLSVFSAIVCSILGIETLGRLSYVIFYSVVTIILFICMVSFKGWQNENFYPILGTSVKLTIFDFSSCGLFLSLITTYLIRESICEPVRTFNLFKRAFLHVFVFGIILLIICILSVPYPMMGFYDFSLAAIFSSAKSNVFFHRFELFLVFLLMIINIMSMSVCLFLSSKLLSDITKSSDSRPFCAVIGCILFYLNLIFSDFKIVVYIYIISSLLIWLLLLLKSFMLLAKQKITKRARH